MQDNVIDYTSVSETNQQLINHQDNITNLYKISLLANIFTTYESMLSGYMAAIIGGLFFKTNSRIIEVMLGFSVFAASYLIRPLGGLAWGYWGDKYGSGLSTRYAMLFSAIPACLIGFLPIYASVGSLATVLLITLKLMQGFCSSGQTTTNFCYVYEESLKTKYSSWFCGLGASGGWAGSLLASCITYLLYASFSDKTIAAWAWRIPFILCIPMSILLFYLRNNIIASLPEHTNNAGTKPLLWLDFKFLKSFFKAFLLISFMEISFNMLFVWMPSYLNNFLHVSTIQSTLSNVISLVFATIGVAFWGYFAKFINYKTIIIGSVLLMTIFSYPLFMLLQHTTFMAIVVIQLIFVLLYTPIEGNYIYAIGKMFKPENRNRGVAMSWTISGSLCGGTTPLICSYFIHTYNFNSFPILYLIMFGVITIPVMLSL